MTEIAVTLIWPLVFVESVLPTVNVTLVLIGEIAMSLPDVTFSPLYKSVPLFELENVTLID